MLAPDTPVGEEAPDTPVAVGKETADTPVAVGKETPVDAVIADVGDVSALLRNSLNVSPGLSAKTMPALQ